MTTIDRASSLQDAMAHPTLRRSQIALRHDLSPGGYLPASSSLHDFETCSDFNSRESKKTPFSLTPFSPPPLPPLPPPSFPPPRLFLFKPSMMSTYLSRAYERHLQPKEGR